MPLFDFKSVPHHEVLPDGRLALLVGDTTAWEIPAGTAGAAYQCLFVLLQFLRRSAAFDQCGSAIADLEDQLRSTGLEVISARGETCEDLAQQIETGRFIVLFVNAGNLWQSSAAVDDGHANHVVLATAVARNPSGELLAVLIRDPARNALRYLSQDLLLSCWLKPSGWMMTADEKVDF